MSKIPIFILTSIFCFNFGKCYYVKITSNGPVVLGSTITFRAELYDSSKTGSYLFLWRDNALPPHNAQMELESTVSYWNVTYDKEHFSPGVYEVEVTVDKNTFIKWPIASDRMFYNITLLLNGDMDIVQKNSTLDRSTLYVSSGSPVKHEITLSSPDADYLKRNASSVTAYWFVDCIYYGMTSDLSFEYNYTGQAGKEKNIEALVIASHVPPTPEPTTTTETPTTSSTSTTTPSSTSTTSSTTTTATPKPNVTTTEIPVTVIPFVVSSTSPPQSTTTAANATRTILKRNSTDLIGTLNMFENTTLIPGKNYSNDPDFPYVCLNSSIIPPDAKQTYGYFHRRLKVEDPVQNVSFTGTNWLKQGDMLNLGVACNGSAPFGNCVKVIAGEYNVTGEESCENERILMDCRFTIMHLFKTAETYTLIIIISNEVSKTVTPVAVNIYEVTKHPQLSVIIVPVACSAVAVILVVFGIAYYIQSRNRYTIEVADFDFAQTSDMEYKTFSERLRDAMSNAMNRTQDYVEEGNVWSPSRKYGSMQ